MKQKFGKTGRERPKPPPSAGGKGKAKAKRQGGKPPPTRSDRQEDEKHMRFRPRIRRKRERQKVVAVVIFENDYQPPAKIYYFRQRVLSQFNGVRMVATTQGDFDRDQIGYFPAADSRISVPDAVRPPQGTLSLKMRLRRRNETVDARASKEQQPQSHRQRLLSLLEKWKQKRRKQTRLRLVKVRTVVALRVDHSSPFGLVSPIFYRGLPNPNPHFFLRSYQVTSWAWSGPVFPRFRVSQDALLGALLKRHFPLLKQAVGASWWPRAAWDYYTKPPEDPRYAALLKEILRPLARDPEVAKQPLAKAFAIKRWLQNHAAYSMRLRSPPVRDHVAYFLFQSRVGYCVHFSHAAVYLMRLAGIPARVAEGYAVPERERGSSSALLVRAGAAHAWPEIYLRGFGWVAFDIYPRRNLDTQRPRPPDPKRRQMLAQLARPKKIPPIKQVEKAAATRSVTKLSWRWLTALLRLPWYWLLVLGLLFLYGLKLWRRFAYLWMPQARRWLLFYRSVEDRLSEHGIRREAGETLEAFAAQHAEALPALTALVQHLSAMHLRGQVDPAALDDTLRTDLARQLRDYFPWYHRWLRAFDTISWAGHVFARWRYLPPAWWLRWLELWEALNTRLNRLSFFFRRAP